MPFMPKTRSMVPLRSLRANARVAAQCGRREVIMASLARNGAIQLGLPGEVAGAALVLHAKSSPALESPFAACNTPCWLTQLRAMLIARHDCTQHTSSSDHCQNGISPFRPKSARSHPCSRFLPYVFAAMGLLTQHPTILNALHCKPRVHHRCFRCVVDLPNMAEIRPTLRGHSSGEVVTR